MKVSDCRTCELPSRILVRGVNWVGDSIMTVPAMKALRQMFASSHITFWVPESLESLLRVSRIPDEIITIPPQLSKLSRPFKMASILRSKGFGLVIHFQNAFESALTSWLARIPIRVGYPTDGRGPLLNVRVPLTKHIKEQHQVYYYLEIVKFLGEYFGLRNRIANGEPDCSIGLNRSISHNVECLLKSYHVENGQRPIICLCPGSVNSDAKRWSLDYFSALADMLIERMDALVLFMGAASETDLINSIICSMTNRRAFNLAGKTDLEQSMGVMSFSDLVISNDTGSAHLAVAAGSKILTIFGPTIPGATAPFGKQAQIIKGQATCAPCRHFTCPLPDHPCMRSITPELVFEKTISMIGSKNEPHGTTN